MLVALCACTYASTELEIEGPGERTQRFSRVYRMEKRHSKKVNNRTVASGAGSSMTYTRSTRTFLETVVRRYDIRSILDVPCGDFQWMPIVLSAQPRIRYFGGDILRELVNEHQQHFASRSRWTFGVVDAANALPSGQYDLVFMRDMLQHLSPGNILDVLRNVNASRFKYLLVTDYPKEVANKAKRGRDIGWDTHMYNLQLAPYRLSPPLERFEEAASAQERPPKFKTMALFKIPLLQRPRHDRAQAMV